MPEIIRITSEALQATIRRLLPSQQGFGDDLNASNVITPIIDLTPSAEGSVLPDYLQQAAAFGSQTAFNCNNNTVTLANSPGFWRIIGAVDIRQLTSVVSVTFNLNDGLGNKQLWKASNPSSSLGTNIFYNIDFMVFLRAGDSVNVVSNNTVAFAEGSYRQIADVNGNLINPSGFTFE